MWKEEKSWEIERKLQAWKQRLEADEVEREKHFEDLLLMVQVVLRGPV